MVPAIQADSGAHTKALAVHPCCDIDIGVVSCAIGGVYRELTWSQVRDQAQQIAGALHQLGLKPGDTVALFQAALEDRLDAYRAPGQALQIPPSFMGDSLVTPENLALARRVGLCVHVWTINDPDEMRDLLRAGVDGLMSDFPARLVAVARDVESAG